MREESSSEFLEGGALLTIWFKNLLDNFLGKLLSIILRGIQQLETSTYSHGMRILPLNA